ncbi:MAG TPA: hypothetical protein VJK53_04980 [Candidatus Paceibacterota bacterium]
MNTETREERVRRQMDELCAEYDISPELAAEATRRLLRLDSDPSLALPDVAPALWSRREEVDRELTPIEFLNKYWGKYLEAGTLFQRDLRELDKSLFTAIKSYCQYRKLNPIHFLPPPARRKKKK